jgi:hypothetical protein
MFRNWYIGMFVTDIRTKFHMSRLNGLLFTVIKLRAIEYSYMAMAMLLFQS